MKTVVIFCGCHMRNRHVITGCTPFEVEQFRRMAARHGWPFTVRKGGAQ